MGSIPERGRGVRDTRLRGPYAEDLEPALESCVKCSVRIYNRRKHSVEPALTVLSRMQRKHQLGWYRRTFGPFVGIEGFFCEIIS